MQGSASIEARYREWAGFWARRLSCRPNSLDGEAMDQADYLQALLVVAWLARARYRSGDSPLPVAVEESRYVLGALRKGAWALSRHRTRRQRLLRELLGDRDLVEHYRWGFSEYEEHGRFESREVLSYLLDRGLGRDVAGCVGGGGCRARYRSREKIKQAAAGMF